MVQVVNKSQQVVTAGLSPRAEYSRIVGAYAAAPGIELEGYGHTGSLGNTVRLLTIKVWFTQKLAGDADWIDFWIKYGSERKVNVKNIPDWDNVIDIIGFGGVPGRFRKYETSRMYTWSINRLFKGKSIRFGIWFEAAGAKDIIEMYATFEISEG